MGWINAARAVAREHQWRYVDRATGHCCSKRRRGAVRLDGFSAGALIAVYDALNEANREVFDALPVDKAARVAFRLLK